MRHPQEGVLSAARLALSIKRFREESPDAGMFAADPVAIVGIGCRFPGDVHSPEDCWRVLAGGVDVVTQVPADRWSVENYYDPDPAASGKTNGRWGGFVSSPELFDPVLFGISPREAASIDPQQRLLLEVAWEAIQDSGRAPESLADSRTGVFAGICISDYERLLFEDASAINSNTCTGVYRSVVSGRISYLLDLRGPSVSIDTACSSSLVAVHLACQSLRSGESDLALAGGVTLHLLPEHYMGLARLGMLSPDGRCKAFDASADGFVPSEGCGLVMLKRLSDALADGDRIYAVIRGSATNQDGRTNSLTAPSGLAQREVVLAALRNAQVTPSSISYVETHGTGTPLGDPIEVEALAAALGAAGEGAETCVLGAAKTNFGHLEAAAGVLGLIKAALALHHETIPANLHFGKLNPHISLEGTRFLIPTHPIAWPRAQAGRFAGVSSFGFSGTNAHVVLEESPRMAVGRAIHTHEGTCALLISARTPEALQDAARQHRIFLTGAGRNIPIYDICHASALRRSHYEERLTLTAGTHEEMCGLVDEFLEGRRRHAIARGRASQRPGPVVFVCSGQGSQWPGMGMTLIRREPIFRAAMEECEEWIRRWAGWSLTDQLSAPEAESKLADTEYAQPAIFAIEVALARLFESWGVMPGAVIGHSAGEVAAAHIGGVLSLGEAARVIVNRARLMQSATGLGKMAVVNLPAAAVAKELALHGDTVSIAAINSPLSTVISGEGAAVDGLFAAWRKRGVECVIMPVNYAFHSAQMEPFHEELVRALGAVERHAGSIPIISTVLGRAASGDEFNATYWGRNIRRTVRFEAAVEAACAMGLETFVEIGPHPVLLNSIRECITARGLSHNAVPTLRRHQDERTALLSSLGDLHAAGHPVSWKAVYRETASPVPLPPYPYQRQRFWVERRPAVPNNRLHPLVQRRLRSPRIHGAAFEAEIATASLQYLAGHRIEGAVMLPMTAFLEMAEYAALATFGVPRALSDITALEPLALAENATATLQIVIEEDRFQIHSLLGEQWKLHASGRIADPAPRLEAPQPGCQQGLAAPELFYAGLAQRGAAFGTSFQTVRALATGPREAWAQVRLGDAEKREAASYQIHPALLDGCLQTAIAAAPDGTDLFLPFAIDRFDCVAQAGSEVRVHARLLPSASEDVHSADIDIRGEDGTMVARIGGVHFKRSTPTDGARKLYEVEWRPARRASALKPARGLWLVAGEDSIASATLAAALNRYGLAAKVAKDGEELRSATGASGLVWLVDTQPGEETARAYQRTSGAVLSIAQDLLRHCSPAPPQLWLVTQGAVAAGTAESCPGLLQSPVWGMARSIAMEHPELGCVRVDLNPDAPDFDALAEEIANWDGEEEIAFRAEARYVPRLAAKLAAGHQPRRWTIPARGSFENLALAAVERRAPGRGEVEVEVETSALNFRDVLNVLGMYPGDPGPLGAEFCGRIARAGEGVSGYRLGDRVMGIAWGSFAAFVTTPAELVIPVPEEWTAVEAATVPNAFLTAYHCLIHLGRLKRGDRVLIHAASGGVGLAAVQLAMHVGAEIFATAGSEQKREYLRSIGVTNIFDSRTSGFRDRISIATGGRGVDLVLNSLAGDLIEAGFALLAEGGRFIEIGKNQIWSPERAAALGKGIEYFIVDLSEQIAFDRPLIQSHLSRIRGLFISGALRPLPARVFSFEDAPAAFRYMAQAKHIGKIVLRHPAGLRVRADATYLITGGLGAIGQRLAEWLVERGARNLVLVGRRGPDPRATETIGDLRRSGARIEIRSADVACRDEIGAVLQEIERDLPPLAGVLHAAGVVDDGIFMEQTWERMDKVLAPKATGAWNLHELTAGKPLDFFVLFSSVASLTGSPGQSGYAAANAFLDALAHYRRAQGLPALSVNWGAWAESGMAAQVEEAGRRRVLPGIRPMKAQRCLASLECAMAEDSPQVAIVDADWSRWNPAPRLLSTVVPQTPAEKIIPDDQSILNRLEAASEGHRRRILVEYLRGQVKSLLGLGVAAPYIDERQPLLRLGMDSLMAVEFRNVLAAALGRSLSATLLFDHPTIGALADFLDAAHVSAHVSPEIPDGGSDARPPRDALLEELEALSDEEAERLLQEELQRK